MYAMTEHEKDEQIARLVEEVSRLRGELNHINEKLNQAYLAYSAVSQGQTANSWSVKDGKLVVPVRQPQMPPVKLEALLNYHQLVEVLDGKQRLTSELSEATKRLSGLAPHLFQ